MANMAKHAFGSEARIEEALQAGTIDAFDILFLDEGKVGWINKEGQKVIAEGEQYVVEVEALPETGEAGKIYIFENEGYIWDGAQFVKMAEPDLTEIEGQIETKVEEAVSAAMEVVEF